MIYWTQANQDVITYSEIIVLNKDFYKFIFQI